MRIPYEAISRGDYHSSFDDRVELDGLHEREVYRLLVAMGPKPDYPKLPEFISVSTFFEKAGGLTETGCLAVRLCLIDNISGASICRLAGEIDGKSSIWTPNETNDLGFYRIGSGLEDPTLSAATNTEIDEEIRRRDNAMVSAAVQGYLLDSHAFNKVSVPIRRARESKPVPQLVPGLRAA